MFTNPKFQSFSQAYFKIKNEVEAQTALKDFMFSLSPDELCDFMLETGRSHNEAIHQLLSTPSVSEAERKEYELQFNKLLAAFANRPSVIQAA
jgi:hypothetical protein